MSLSHKTDSNAPPPPRPLSTAEIQEYLEYACSPLIDRRDQLIKALTANIKASPVIDDDETLGDIAENMRMAGVLVRQTAEERRTETKAPFLAGGRTIDGWFKTWRNPLENIMTTVQVAMNTYGEKKLAAERRRAEDERRRAFEEAERMARIAAAALEQGSDADIALTRAVEAAAEAEAAEAIATARAPDLTRTRGVYGAVASVRETWSWEVTDMTKVPWPYLMIDEAAVKEAAKKRDPSGKPVAVIPGIKWVSSSKMGVR